MPSGLIETSGDCFRHPSVIGDSGVHRIPKPLRVLRACRGRRSNWFMVAPPTGCEHGQAGIDRIFSEDSEGRRCRPGEARRDASADRKRRSPTTTIPKGLSFAGATSVTSLSAVAGVVDLQLWAADSAAA